MRRPNITAPSFTLLCLLGGLFACENPEPSPIDPMPDHVGTIADLGTSSPDSSRTCPPGLAVSRSASFSGGKTRRSILTTLGIMQITAPPCKAVPVIEMSFTITSPPNPNLPTAVQIPWYSELQTTGRWERVNEGLVVNSKFTWHSTKTAIEPGTTQSLQVGADTFPAPAVTTFQLHLTSYTYLDAERAPKTIPLTIDFPVVEVE